MWNHQDNKHTVLYHLSVRSMLSRECWNTQCTEVMFLSHKWIFACNEFGRRVISSTCGTCQKDNSSKPPTSIAVWHSVCVTKTPFLYSTVCLSNTSCDSEHKYCQIFIISYSLVKPRCTQCHCTMGTAHWR